MAEGPESSLIVVVPLPAQGHVPPIITLSRKLARRGFSVVILNIESVHAKVIKKWDYAANKNIKLQTIPFDFPIPKALDANALYTRGALLNAFDLLQDPFDVFVTGILRSGTRILCVISDYHVTWTRKVAAKHGIKHACFFSGSAAWTLTEYYVPVLDEKGFIPMPEIGANNFEEKNSKMITFIKGMDPFRPAELPYYLHEHMLRGQSRVQLLKKRPRLETDDWIMVNTFKALEPTETEAMKSLLGRRFIPIGPLLDYQHKMVVSLETEESDTVLKWLDKREVSSVLYISFGSLAVLSEKQFEELVFGVENSGHYFLWVIRPEFLAAGISRDFYEQFAKRTSQSGKGLIVSWTPQQLVLAHSAIGGFLTHCGWNSTLESIWNGVPMLGWPCNSDQNMNSRLILQRHGLGLSVPRKAREDLVSKEHVTTCIQKVMCNGDMKANVLKFKELARKSVGHGGSSHTEFELMINSLI